MKKALCLRVPKRLGEKTILASRGFEILDNDLTIRKEDDYVIIPLSRRPTLEEVAMLKKQLQEVDVTMDRFEEKRRRTKTLFEAIGKRLPSHMLTKLPRSMDIVGQVAIVKIPTELEDYKKLIGKAVLDVNKSVKTVLAKAGAVGGEFRLRRFEIIAGVEKTKTIYREHGCIYHLDPMKVYFSPRLSQERWRIAQKVTDREIVIDMFAGVGPFSIQIAKKQNDTKVYAIDSNPSAIKFLKCNIIANKVDNVFPELGDAREVIEKNHIGKGDRVIMNLPKRAIEFIDVACKSIKPSGGIIHYYGFEVEPNALEMGEERLGKAVSRAGKEIKKVLNRRIVRPTAPREWQVAFDILVY